MSKPPFILLVNPWVTDFAAFDLWASPMGLLVLASLLREGGCGVELLDCMDRRDPFTAAHCDVIAGTNRRFGAGRYPKMRIPKPEPYASIPRHYYRHGIHPDSFRQRLGGLEKPDLIWVTSIMTYWYPEWQRRSLFFMRRSRQPPYGWEASMPGSARSMPGTPCDRPRS